ncbi:MAG: hypothetical protein CO189_06680 [candidate division Zixibacteria bacterium CG_4_9_14_3_um_filter_46_8]|nr:MAG: hypothetical protein CO189_06680 [candidate division Zixibacteria bacterium CG_4_9_14_3_um_filter_46_8]
MNRSFNAHECLHAQALHGTPLASFFSRVFAFLIDFLVVLVLVILVGLPAAFYAREQGQTQQIVIRFEPFHNLWGLVALVAYFGFITFVARGQTVGKRLLAIRVVSLASDRLTLWQCIERALGYGASALEAGFGFLQFFLHPNRQTVHDRIAETIVVSSPRRKRNAP